MGLGCEVSARMSVGLDGSVSKGLQFLSRGFASKWLFTALATLAVFASCFAITSFAPVRTAMAATTQAVTIQGAYHQTEAHKMLGLVNEFRTNEVSSAHNGNEPWYWDKSDSKRVECEDLGELEWNYSLEKIARQRAAEIAAVFSHTRPNGESCFTAKDGGIRSYGENIASGMGSYEDAQSAFVGWREDDKDYSGQGHRRNMLSDGFTAFAAACFEIDGVYFWVQEFGYAESEASCSLGDKPKVDALVYVNPENKELTFDFAPTAKSVEIGKAFVLPERLAGVFEPWNGAKIHFFTELPEPSLWKQKNGFGCVSHSDGLWCDAVAAGAADFEASILGKTAKFTALVPFSKTSITGLESTKLVKVGESFTLKATTDSDARITWSSSNPEVATVDDAGSVIAKKAGSATIKASVSQTPTHEAADATCKVTVTSPAPVVAPGKPSGDQPTTKPSSPSVKPETPKPTIAPAKPSAPKVSAPKGTSLTKVSKAKKAFTAKWKKASGVKGYQIRYSTKSNMAGAKSITVKSAKTTSKKVSKLKKKTKYYVQVRTYKVVNGKTYWSGWSKAKSVKTK